MGLSGLQIQKLLPKTNCKECGSNTCLAFAMKLAAKKAGISECPYASDEAIKVLGAASEPPVREIKLGKDLNVKIGGETVLYRHEKTFVNQTLFAININDSDSEEKINKVLDAIDSYVLERVGETHRVDMVSITQKGNDHDKYIKLVKKTWDKTQRPLIIRSDHVETIKKAAEAVKNSHCVLCAASPQIAGILLDTTKSHGHALSVTAKDMNDLTKLTAKMKEDDFNDIILQFETYSLSEHFQVNSIARRAALLNNYKPLGYPYIFYASSDNLFENTIDAITEICKYGGIFVLSEFNAAQLATLMTLKLNIFTDPQKPIQVEPKVYPIGEPKEDSPVFVTTNFSLTYFIVSGEIENSGISAWLVVPECEGMSVLTAWAAGKFSGVTIAKFIKEIDLISKIKTREIIIPGYVAQISGELEENLPDWKVMVGPQEAADLESYIKNKLK